MTNTVTIAWYFKCSQVLQLIVYFLDFDPPHPLPQQFRKYYTELFQ